MPNQILQWILFGVCLHRIGRSLPTNPRIGVNNANPLLALWLKSYQAVATAIMSGGRRVSRAIAIGMPSQFHFPRGWRLRSRPYRERHAYRSRMNGSDRSC